MPGRAAGHHADAAHSLEVLVGKTGGGEVRHAVARKGVEGVRHRLGLLVDLLHHEVLVAGFFGGLRIPLDGGEGLFNDVAVQVVEGHLARLQAAQLHVADVVNIPGELEDGRRVGGQEGLPFAHADDHGAVFPGGPDLAGIVLEHHRQRVGAADAHHGMVDGVHRGALVFLVVIIDELHRHLGVGGGIKAVALFGQLVFQLLVVLDDAVVHRHHVHVVAAVGVGVDLAGLAVGGPAGVADAAAARQSQTPVYLFRKDLQPAFGLHQLHRGVAVPGGDPRRVIAPVLQFGKPLQKKGRGLLCARVSHDPAHWSSPPVILRFPRKPPFPLRFSASFPFHAVWAIPVRKSLLCKKHGYKYNRFLFNCNPAFGPGRASRPAKRLTAPLRGEKFYFSCGPWSSFL